MTFISAPYRLAAHPSCILTGLLDGVNGGGGMGCLGNSFWVLTCESGDPGSANRPVNLLIKVNGVFLVVSVEEKERKKEKERGGWREL